MPRKRRRQISSDDGSAELDRVDGTPAPAEMVGVGRRRSGRLKRGSAAGSQMASPNYATMEDRPAVRGVNEVKDLSASRSSLVVKLQIPSAALRRLEDCGRLFDLGVDGLPRIPRSLHETESTEKTPPSPRELDTTQLAAKYTPASDVATSQHMPVAKLPIPRAGLRGLQDQSTLRARDDDDSHPTPRSITGTEASDSRSHETPPGARELNTTSPPPQSTPLRQDDECQNVSASCEAHDNENITTTSPARVPNTHPRLPRDLPSSPYVFFGIPLPTKHPMPPAVEQPPEYPLPSAQPPAQPAEPYHSAPPVMLAEVLEITRHQARLQVLQASALQCLSDYHYWTIHNPILCVPYKAFFRRLAGELKQELKRARNTEEAIETAWQETARAWEEVQCDPVQVGLKSMDHMVLVEVEEHPPSSGLEDGSCYDSLFDSPRSVEPTGDVTLAPDSRTLHADDEKSNAELKARESSPFGRSPGRGLVETAIREQLVRSISTWSALDDPPTAALESGDKSKATQASPPGTSQALNALDVAIRVELRPKADDTFFAVNGPEPAARKDGVSHEEVARSNPPSTGTTITPGPLEMAIRAELAEKSKDGSDAKKKTSGRRQIARAPNKRIANKEKDLNLKANVSEPGLIDTPPPKSSRYANDSASESSPPGDFTESSEDEDGKESCSSEDVEPIALQNPVHRASYATYDRRMDLMHRPPVLAPPPQNSHLAQPYCRPPPYQRIHFQHNLIPPEVYRQRQYLQQPQLQTRIQLPSSHYPYQQLQHPFQIPSEHHTGFQAPSQVQLPSHDHGYHHAQPQLRVPPPHHPYPHSRFQQTALPHHPHQQLQQPRASVPQYLITAPSPYPPRKKPWDQGYHQQRNMVLDPPPLPLNNWNAVHTSRNPAPLRYHLQFWSRRERFTSRLQIVSGHLRRPVGPRSPAVAYPPPSARPPRCSTLVVPDDGKGQSRNGSQEEFAKNWKWPRACSGPPFKPARNYKLLLWQHPLTLDLPKEFLEQGALEPPPSDSSEELSPPRKYNNPARGRTISAAGFEPPEITRSSSDEESHHPAINSPRVVTREPTASAPVAPRIDPPGNSARSTVSNPAPQTATGVENRDDQQLSAIFANAARNRTVVAPFGTNGAPHAPSPSVDHSPLFRGADSPGESVHFEDTNDACHCCYPPDEHGSQAPNSPRFDDDKENEDTIPNLAVISNRLSSLPLPRAKHATQSGCGISAGNLQSAGSNPRPPSADRSRAAVFKDFVNVNMKANDLPKPPSTTRAMATYKGPPITIPRTLVQKPTAQKPLCLTTRDAAPAESTIVSAATGPISLGNLLKNIHRPLAGPNNPRPTSAYPRPAQTPHAGPTITAAARKQLTMRRNAEKRRKQREADEAAKSMAMEKVKVPGKRKEKEKGKEKETQLTGAEMAKKIIERKYGEGGAKRIYLTPEELLGRGLGSGGGRNPAAGRDKGKEKENGKGKVVGGVVPDARVGDDQELLPIGVAAAMRKIAGKQGEKPEWGLSDGEDQGGMGPTGQV